MFRFIRRIIIQYYHNKFIKLLNKQSGVPRSIFQWKVRAMTCEKLIKTLEHSKNKITALSQIKEECEEKAKQMTIEKQKEYLSQFSSKEGYDKFIQIGGRDFAQEIWFHKDKSKITVLNNNSSIDYEMFGEIAGKWYHHTFNGVSYQITLGPKSPAQILISTDDETGYDSFTIVLKPKI